MSEVIDYKSRVSDPASRKFETFSYLPAMTAENIKKQVEYLVQEGLEPCDRAHRARVLDGFLLVYVETANVWRNRC